MEKKRINIILGACLLACIAIWAIAIFMVIYEDRKKEKGELEKKRWPLRYEMEYYKDGRTDICFGMAVVGYNITGEKLYSVCSVACTPEVEKLIAKDKEGK